MATRRRARKNPRGLASINTDLHDRGTPFSERQRLARLETAVVQTQTAVISHKAKIKALEEDVAEIRGDLRAINTFNKQAEKMLNDQEKKLSGK